VATLMLRLFTKIFSSALILGLRYCEARRHVLGAGAGTNPGSERYCPWHLLDLAGDPGLFRSTSWKN
jgi:hypothetical protein